MYYLELLQWQKLVDLNLWHSNNGNKVKLKQKISRRVIPLDSFVILFVCLGWLKYNVWQNLNLTWCFLVIYSQHGFISCLNTKNQSLNSCRIYLHVVIRFAFSIMILEGFFVQFLIIYLHGSSVFANNCINPSQNRWKVPDSLYIHWFTYLLRRSGSWSPTSIRRLRVIFRTLL